MKTKVSHILVAVLIPCAAFAQTEWTNTGTGSWGDASNWDSGLPDSGTPAYLGNGGTASLGSGVTGEFAALNVGNADGESGTILLSGGSLSGSVVFLGNADGASGILTLNSGTMSNLFGFIGYEAGSQGDATVSGGSWTSSNDLAVGFLGSGTLSISAGTVSNVDGYIGSEAGSSGTVSVSGGTWTQSGGLFVGSSGQGELTISGGSVSAGGVVYAGNNSGATGNIRITGTTGNRGILEALAIQENSGDGTLAFDGGVLRAQSDRTSFLFDFEAGDVVIESGGAFFDSAGFAIGTDVVLSGVGALTKQGAGALTLSGSNAYAGGSVVESGELIVANNDALGSGGVTVNTGATLTIQTGFSATNQIALAGGSLARELNSNADLAGSFNVTSQLPGGAPDTTATLLAGTTSTATTITAEFSGMSAASNDAMRRSDVLHLDGIPVVSGLETDIFVLELSMTSVDPGSYLGWLNGGNEWVNAALGNTGNTASGDQLGYAGTFAEFQIEYSTLLSDYIGAWGFTSTSVWTVLNHNSDFAALPEPSIITFLALSAGGLLLRRKSRAR